MADLEFNATEFRKRFTAFSNQTEFTDATLTDCWDRSECYIDHTAARSSSETCRRNLLELMTAHLCQINVIIASGKTPGIKTSSSVGGISVSIQAPPVGSSQWAWWLNLTAYGQQFHACLSGLVAGGRYLFGRRERSAFRKVGGYF